MSVWIVGPRASSLERDPIGELRRMYETLGLPSFDVVEPQLRKYVASITNYEKNTFLEMPSNLKLRIAETCRRGFEEWGYQR